MGLLQDIAQCLGNDWKGIVFVETSKVPHAYEALKAWKLQAMASNIFSRDSSLQYVPLMHESLIGILMFKNLNMTSVHTGNVIQNLASIVYPSGNILVSIVAELSHNGKSSVITSIFCLPCTLLAK